MVEFERRRLRVYVAGPISNGDVFENVVGGVRWARRMLKDGLAPYCPHLDAYLTMDAAALDPDIRNPLLEWDMEWVAASEAVFRIQGASEGADLECAIAKSLGIPVFYEGQDGGDYGRLLAFASNEGLTGVRT